MSSLIDQIKRERARSKQLRLLIVEDDIEVAMFIQNHLSVSYSVELAQTGAEALSIYRRQPPSLLILASHLPDTDVLSLLQALRRASAGRLIPIIILGRPDDTRALKLAALELGVADYLIKPFDMDELRYRVRNTLPKPHQQANLITGLPGWLATEDTLRTMLNQANWHILLIQIQHLEPFRLVNGYIAGNDVMRTTAYLLADAAGKHGRFDDFLGQTSDNTFIIITSSAAIDEMIAACKHAFRDQRDQFYTPPALARGYLMLPDGQKAPLMRLAIGAVNSRNHHFDDTLSVIAAAETRCQADQTNNA